MRFSFGQELRQEQKQVLTQRMIQSMEILQLSVLQLEERIDQELEKNPLLELDADVDSRDEYADGTDSNENDLSQTEESANEDSSDYFSGDDADDSYNANDSNDSGDSGNYEFDEFDFGAVASDDSKFSDADVVDKIISDGSDSDSGSGSGSDVSVGSAGVVSDGVLSSDLPIVSDMREKFQIADEFAQVYADTIDEMPSRSQNWLEDQNERRNDAEANIPSPSQTLQEYLTGQLSWFDFSEPVRLMLDRIINNIDSNGYFPYSKEEFLGDGLLVEGGFFDEAMLIIRKLDPPGIGGRDLKDCLILQIDPNSPNCDLVRELVLSHLEDVSANRMLHIVRAMGYSVERIQSAIVELRRLNPRPGAEFSGEAAMKIIPDVIVEKNDEGKYVVRLEEGRSHQLHISEYYCNMLKNRNVDKDTRDYIKQHAGSAKWLIDAIEQRKGTLLRVAQAIVDHQIDFFEQGNHAIKPLKMLQIAEVVGVHITTVSRACDEKWMMTPQGVYPFRRFFSGTIASSDGSVNVSQDVVRIKLQEIVDNEDKNAPLSDEAIVESLKEVGVQVARRTVVKYRQLLNIPSSRARKSWNGK
ncbi:MAG: RNA polymerase factor sigma-54 [Planctomycetaceae bacterium]|jgi:RNA polymerase sigma-54 factor|nr:RNA polymerase factor sigma-54 [Planctomycetaceae bacterium]